MKKMMKRLFVAFLILSFFLPVTKVFAVFDEGDSTIFVRVPEGHGCYYVETIEHSERYCGTGRYFFPAGTEVVLRADPEEGYHLVGWYGFHEEDSDGQGTMVYPLNDEPDEISERFAIRTEANGVYNYAPVFAEGTAIDEIVITGEIALESLTVGELDPFTVETTTEHITIEEYGSNTNWAKLPRGYENWSGFGLDTPTAEDDGTFYAMRLAVHTDDGYVIKPTTRIVYNERDMEDTYSTIMPYEWGAYVFVDFGQVFSEEQPPEWIDPEVDGEVITRISVNVDFPKVGEEIELNEAEGYQGPQAVVHINEEDPYQLKEGNNYMYYFSPEGALMDGVFEAGRPYRMHIWLTAKEGLTFADNVEVFINGRGAELVENENGTTVIIECSFEPEPEDREYTVETEDNSAIVIFNAPDGHHFDLLFDDILSHTPEEIEELYDIPADYVAQVIDAIKEVTKEYGSLLGVYAIEIGDRGFNYSDALTLRIKMTEDMEKYDGFKFIFLDETHDFEVQETFNVTVETIEGVKYLVVELPHLSAYALVGYNNTPNNPATGDKIVFYTTMLGLCTIGLVGTAFYTKKKYFN